MELPDELDEALAESRLVIFVGAGASIDPPSSLPSFVGLTKAICSSVGERLTRADVRQPDFVLGRLHDRGIDVHRQVELMIGDSRSRPNATHQAVARLAACQPKVRIVTTNYDRHLSLALKELGVVAPEYVAPALPIGDDFSGVVYLHGSLDHGRGHERRLVVTDSDFGRAYLQDAWAARFLERMFHQYTTLFVGYSHGDAVMTYLARGLRPGAQRYLFTESQDEPTWRKLGVVPVSYRVHHKSHHQLTETLNEWSEQRSMGLLDHRQRIADQVATAPSGVPSDDSYLRRALADPVRVRFFTEFADGVDWLGWACGTDAFKEVFSQPTRTECSSVLASWFVGRYAMIEAQSAAALAVVRENGGKLGPILWGEVGFHLHRQPGPRPSWLNPWLLLMMESGPDRDRHWLPYVLQKTVWHDDSAIALLLFEHLTTPLVDVGRSLSTQATAHLDVGFRCDKHDLDAAWSAVFFPNLTSAAERVLPIVERQLHRIADLLLAAGQRRDGWDPVSFRRASIRGHAQNWERGAISFIIDTARDCLDSLLVTSPDWAATYLERWSESNVAILRRLAIHGWTNRSDVDNDAKIVWLLRSGILFDQQYLAEVMHLIETVAPRSSASACRRLVRAALGAPTGSDGAADAQHRLDVLGLIARGRPRSRSAHEAIGSLQREFPDLRPGPRVDHLPWITVGSVPPHPPMTKEEAHARLLSDPVSLLDDLQRFESINFSVDSTTWDDAIGLLAQTVREYPDDGFVVLDHAPSVGLIKAAIDGWSGASLSAEKAPRVLQHLSNLSLVGVAETVSRLLGDGGQSDRNPTAWHLYAEARELASRLWEHLTPEDLDDEPDDWLAHAINRPAGQLAEFWLHATSADWSAAGENWTGMPHATKTALEAMLSGDDGRTGCVQSLLASQLHFLYGADQVWCQGNVLPLLAWSSPWRARRAWDGYLTWGRWNDRLLSSGLLDMYIDTVRHQDKLRPELRRQINAHLASIALQGLHDPRSWLSQFVLASPPEGRVQWANEVGELAERLPPEAVEHQWQRWMREYWQRRLDGTPLQLDINEATAMAPWVLSLTTSTREGVALASGHAARLDGDGDLLRKLNTGILDGAPAELSALLLHLLHSTERPFWAFDDLANIVRRLRTLHETDHERQLIEQAVRLGNTDAINW